LLLALCVGFVLSGYVTLLLLRVDTGLFTWNTYWQYWQARELPQFVPYATKIRWAGYLGFGLPLLAYAWALVKLLKRKTPDLHGDARFATAADLKRQGFFKDSDDGIVVGKWGSKLMRMSGQQFAILAAPVRSGKSVGIVIPNLLTYRHSMVVLDIKQELYERTSGWRASIGQAVFLFNPFAEDGRTHRWNPFTYISPKPAVRISDVQAMAAMLYPDRSEDNAFWVSQARNAFVAFALYLFEEFDHKAKGAEDPTRLTFPSLGAMYRLSSGQGQELKPYLQGLMQAPFLSEDARTAFANLVSQADDTFSSIMGMFKEPLNPWISPILDAATSGNDFLLTGLRRKKMTIYIGIPPHKLAEARGVLNLFISQLINLNTKELPENNPALKYQCLLMMDEFTSVGRLDTLVHAVTHMAQYGLRIFTIIQSVAQLEAVYGEKLARVLMTNHALQILYAPREQRDANEYSEMMGYVTVIERNRSQAKGRRGEATYTESKVRRALMLPQELKAMSQQQQVCVYENLKHPVKCKKIRYFEDKFFTDRLLPAVKIEPVQWETRTAPAVAIPLAQATEHNAAGAAIHDDQEHDEMKWSQVAATAALAVGLASGCAPSGGQKSGWDSLPGEPEYRRNPNPQEKYELTVTLQNAPGPMVLQGASAAYYAPDCAYMVNRLAGASGRPSVGFEIELTQIDATTWVGVFYRDAMLDEDYDGPQGAMRPCHWQVLQVGATLTATGAPTDTRYSADLRRPEAGAKEQAVTLYFNKRSYPGDPTDDEPYSTSGGQRSQFGPTTSDDDLFSVTLSARQVQP
jgi:type IV secretion system protein VirD4